MNPRVDAVNRTALFVIGLLLLAAGVLGLVVGLGGFGSGTVNDPVVPAQWPSYLSSHGWVWWAALLLALLVAYLGLRWLLAQLRTDRVSRLDLTRRLRDGRTIVHAGAIGDAVTAEANRVPGVARSTVRVVSGAGYRLHLGCDLTDRADLAEVRRGLEDRVVADVRSALAQPQLPVSIELRLLRTTTTGRQLR